MDARLYLNIHPVQIFDWVFLLTIAKQNFNI